MKIEFLGNVSTEPEAYLAVCRRLLRWGDPELDTTVHVYPRDRHGALEWHLDLRRPDGSQIIFIGMIQREAGAEFSFHS